MEDLFYINWFFNENENDFESLIGHDQSLKEAIMLAKAAILYPSVLPKILLTTERGSGIDCFVKSIYEFAVKSKVLKIMHLILF